MPQREEDVPGRPPVSAAYTEFADAYLAGGERRFSEEMAVFAIERAEKYLKSPLHRVADIACGVGAACAIFAQRGLDVTGADCSAEMIRNAEVHSNRGGRRIRFLVQDYREFRSDQPYDLVTCMYDSLNFMTSEAELQRAFQAVRRSLVEGGVFVFDMYTVRGLAEFWGTRAEIHTVAENHFVASQTSWSYETTSNTKVLYGFSRRADGLWQRWEERHSMSAYPLARLRALLSSSGFVVHEGVDWDQPQRAAVSESTHRVVFVAGRRESGTTGKAGGL